MNKTKHDPINPVKISSHSESRGAREHDKPIGDEGADKTFACPSCGEKKHKTSICPSMLSEIIDDYVSLEVAEKICRLIDTEKKGAEFQIKDLQRRLESVKRQNEVYRSNIDELTESEKEIRKQITVLENSMDLNYWLAMKKILGDTLHLLKETEKELHQNLAKGDTYDEVQLINCFAELFEEKLTLMRNSVLRKREEDSV
ncbi:MAG TPA: hypothetical protein VJP79_02185 [Nitrososphaera sp.]|nr:hypothetical protein [Nitrososphaera sp.]